MQPFIDDFATPEFIRDNKSFYDKYIEYRVHGYSSHAAFNRVFGSDHWQSNQQGYIRIEAMESTDYYKAEFERQLQGISTDKLWNTKLSLHELLATMRGPFTKDSTRLAAIKELNVLVGITVVDENGKTKAGRKLSDFYDSEGDGATPAKPTPAAPV
jgi:hypothetical protein